MTKILREENAPQQDELQDAFRAFDKNSNGHCNVQELKRILTATRILTDSDFDEIIKDAGVDEEGDFEYEALVKKIMKV